MGVPEIIQLTEEPYCEFLMGKAVCVDLLGPRITDPVLKATCVGCRANELGVRLKSLN